MVMKSKAGRPRHKLIPLKRVMGELNYKDFDRLDKYCKANKEVKLNIVGVAVSEFLDKQLEKQ